MSSDDLDAVLTWRNHQKVRRYMLNGRLIGAEEHYAWFARASSDRSRILLIIEEKMDPFGFVQFSDIDADGVAEWGFYVRPDAERGGGRKLAFCALHYAFDKVGLRKVYGRVMDINAASIAFHKMIGFKEEGIISDRELKDDSFRSLILFGLERCNWDSERLTHERKNAND